MMSQCQLQPPAFQLQANDAGSILATRLYSLYILFEFIFFYYRMNLDWLMNLSIMHFNFLI